MRIESDISFDIKQLYIIFVNRNIKFKTTFKFFTMAMYYRKRLRLIEQNTPKMKFHLWGILYKVFAKNTGFAPTP